MLKKVVSVHQVGASQGHRGWEGRSVGHGGGGHAKVSPVSTQGRGGAVQR